MNPRSTTFDLNQDLIKDTCLLKTSPLQRTRLCQIYSLKKPSSISLIWLIKVILKLMCCWKNRQSTKLINLKRESSRNWRSQTSRSKTTSF